MSQASDGPGAPEAAHDPDVHVFEESGIREGNAPVPRWYLGVVVALFLFMITYLTLYLTGVQPSAAQLK